MLRIAGSCRGLDLRDARFCKTPELSIIRQVKGRIL